MTQQQIPQGLLAQLEALTQGFKQRGNLGQLSPELLAYLSGQQGGATNGGLFRGLEMDDGRTLRQYGQYALADPYANPEAQSVSTDPSRINWGQAPIDFMLNTDESNHAAVFDPSGRFIGYEQRQDDKDWRDVITVAAILAGGYFGGNYLAGAGEGAAGIGGGAGAGGGAGGTGATGASGAAGASSITLPTTEAMAAGMAPASVGQAAAVMPTVNIAGGGITAAQAASAASAAGGGGGGGQSGTSGVSDFRQGEINSYQSDPNAVTKAATTSGNMSDFDRWWEGVKQAAGTGAGSDPKTSGYWDVASKLLTGGGGGWGDVVGGLLGAYAGYQSGKDKENTTKTEPWGPAQPYLQGLLREGAGLYDQYKATPFSDAERTAYGNAGNVLDFINGNAPGLMSGFDATAAGKNQFVRGQPRGLIGNSYDAATSPVAWRPGLLGDFGTTTAAVRRR